MQILLVGLNHTTSPVEVRERVSFTRDQLAEAIPTLRAEVGEGVILSTCNRTEVYTVPDDPDDPDFLEEGSVKVARFLSNHSLGSVPGERGRGGVSLDELRPFLYQRSGMEAARHLFRVSCGLDSMILGESQILGQVRTAMTAAADAAPLSPQVSRLFHSAVRTGRRVREETDIGRNALTVSFAGARLVERTLGDLSGLTALLIGAGEAGRLVAEALVSSGVGRIIVTNRTPARAADLARDLKGETVPFDELSSALSRSDILITAVDTGDHVLTSEQVSAAMRGRESRLLILDLGVPRNVDPASSEVAGVVLRNIDDLASVTRENLETREGAVREAELVVEDELDRFSEWWNSREAVSVIRDVRELVEATRRRELDKALRMMPELTDDQRAVVEAMSKSLVSKLLHRPTVRLKDPASRHYLKAIKDLFGL